MPDIVVSSVIDTFMQSADLVNARGNLQFNVPATAATLGSSGFTAAAGTPAMQMAGSINSYLQLSLQNINAGVAASSDIVVNNDVSTDTTFYGNLGINSSTFTGTGNLNKASAAYLTSTTGDLSIGTTTANAVHFVVNMAATDVMTLSSDGLSVQLPSTTTSGLQLYNTADQTTNYERLQTFWNSNIGYIGFTYAGGATARAIKIGVGSVNVATPTTRSMQIQNAFPLFDFDLAATTSLTTQGNWMRLLGTNTSTTGSGAVLAINPTYNQASGVAANTDLLSNRTQTQVGSGTQKLADLQVGGTSWYSFATGNTATTGGFNSSSTVEPAVTFAPIINQSGTAGYTALKVAVTETATGSGTKNVFQLLAGASGTTSVFSVSNTGLLTGPQWNMSASGGLGMSSKINTYQSVTTSGWGVPAIYGTNSRATGVTSAQASLYTYTVGAADGSFLVSGNVLVTAAVTASFTMTVAYTDEGNTARTLTLPFSQTSGTILTTITNVTGTGAYEGVQLHIRAKASTTITFATVGTFTSVTYNAEGTVQQIS